MSVSDEVPTVRDGATIVGPGTIGRLPELVAATGAQRVLLVCGRASFEASGAARTLPMLEAQASVLRWNEHRPNPSVEDIVAGLSVAHAHRPDVVVGVGGGSTLDTAKLVAALHATDDGTDAARTARTIETHDAGAQRGVGLLLAPTTSGSGAQVTHFATVYVGTAKHSVVGAALLPDRIVLDPTLATSGSAYQRACSGIDALAQAIESLWAVGADERSRQHAEHAIRLLMPAVVRFSREPDEASAEAMARGSQEAGSAINRSRTTLPHALSYALTQQVGLPHGHAVAHTLPAVLDRHLHASDEEIVGVTSAAYRSTVARLVDALGAADADDAVTRVENVVADLGLRDSNRSSHATILAQVYPLAASVDLVRLANNPVRFTAADLRDIVRAGIRDVDGRPGPL